MNAELVLALHMANLAAAWDALAAETERNPAGMHARVRADIYRECASDLRDRLEMHRTGPAWSVTLPFGVS